MYDFLYRRKGERVAFYVTSFWYAALLVLVILSLFAPAGEFRYGNI